MAESPLTVVERLVDQRVALLLKDGREIEGKLLGLDDHLNLVLDDGTEKAADASRHLGRLVVRGSSVVTLYAASGPRAKSR
jgi:small nuclear ribonucleoprotein (snRNP)-like protein